MLLVLGCKQLLVRLPLTSSFKSIYVPRGKELILILINELKKQGGAPEPYRQSQNPHRPAFEPCSTAREELGATAHYHVRMQLALANWRDIEGKSENDGGFDYYQNTRKYLCSFSHILVGSSRAFLHSFTFILTESI